MKFVRRDFLKISGVGAAVGSSATAAKAVGSESAGAQASQHARAGARKRPYNGSYSGAHLNRVAFPIGGIGAGMICLEGTGALSHVSLRNQPDVFNEPFTFAAISIKGVDKGAKVLEGSVPNWKVFGSEGAANGARGSSFGFPRFSQAEFLPRFPFATVSLRDSDIPLEVDLTGWSPFIPGNEDDSSLPVGAFEYRFKNLSESSLEATFSYNARNFMGTGREGNSIKEFPNGFLLWQEGTEEKPQDQGGFVAFVDDPEVVVDHCWFRGGWFDPGTMAWKNIRENTLSRTPPVDGTAPGASLFLPFRLAPGQEKVVRLLVAWHVPRTNQRTRALALEEAPEAAKCEGDACCPERPFHVPWYAGRFADIESVAAYWRENYDSLRAKSTLFRDAFYDTTLPLEVVEAVAANLTILKSPTVRRQCDGRLWCWEGCFDTQGCCAGSCTHVWNYAQAIPHLFPALERTLRRSEFYENQDETGHQVFRSPLPVRPIQHTYFAASDGQLGGIMKVHREWRISGDPAYLEKMWPRVKQSLDYCIQTWDPRGIGVLEEPHHNTYDINFWGPDGMCSSFYLGALAAAIAMGTEVGEGVGRYAILLSKGRAYLENELFNGEYFYQRIQWKGLSTPDPVEAARARLSDPEAQSRPGRSREEVELLEEEGPKYQYGNGCLSDGVVGFWMARMCGLGEIVDEKKVRKNLKSIHKYNLKHDLSDHANPQRPSYALGNEGGLLLCTWPKGGEPSLPFVYSNEVWTGIEYQVASHLMLEGLVEEGLEVVRTCRDRYDGQIRNPFNEYECGHWYARALASYGLIQGLTGVRYDAVEKTLYIDSQIGDDFKSFLSTESGFGSVGLRGGQPFVEMKMGTLALERVKVGGREMAWRSGSA